MTQLTHGQTIRLAAWNRVTCATVFGIEGYAAQDGRDPVAMRAQTIARGHDIVGSIYAGAALVNDPSGAFHAAEVAKAASAVTLEDGQTVEIEGSRYTVKVRARCTDAPRLSDPIAFIAA